MAVRTANGVSLLFGCLESRMFGSLGCCELASVSGANCLANVVSFVAVCIRSEATLTWRERSDRRDFFGSTGFLYSSLDVKKA